MNRLSIALAAVAALGASALSGETIDIYATWNGQAFADKFTGFASGNTYTLSDDFAVTNSAGAFQETRLPVGDTTFDFSEGGHTLRTGLVKLYNNLKKPYKLTFKGGTWDIVRGAFYFGGWYNLPYNGVTYEFDDMVVSNHPSGGMTLMDGYGTNLCFIVKNDSEFHVDSEYLNLCPATVSGLGDAVSKHIEFRGGSKFYTGDASVYDSRNTETDRMQNTVIRFTGEGTVATGTEAAGAGKSDFYLGFKAPGYRLEVTDDALFSFRFFYVGGYYNTQTQKPTGQYGFSNTVYVADGGEINAVYGLHIGDVVGADFNTVVIGEGGAYSNGMDSPISIGTRGSFNSFIVSNATVSTKQFQVGYYACSTGNLLRLSGADTKLNLNSENLTFFWLGAGNTVELCDGFTYGTASTTWRYTGDSIAGTGNVFRIDSGAAITGEYFKVAYGDGSTNNLFFVGNGASVTATDVSMSNVKTFGNVFCISNGTVNFTGSYGFYCAGTGSVAKIQGDSPRVRFIGGDSSDGVATFRNGVELLFDITGLSAGYAEPVFLTKQFQMRPGTKLSFEGVEEVSARIKSRIDFVLARTTGATAAESTLDGDVFAAAQASLPPRTELFFANDGNDLVLRVRPARVGLKINIR